MRYIVVSADRDGDMVYERAVADMDRASTVRDISYGQFGEVIHVIEFNIAEGIICDRTEDVLSEAAQFGGNDPPPLTGQNLLDWQADHKRKLRDG
jgi:hypothetical protein